MAFTHGASYSAPSMRCRGVSASWGRHYQSTTVGGIGSCVTRFWGSFFHHDVLNALCGTDFPQEKIERVAELAFREGIWEQIRLRESRFHEHAYLFVLAALEFQQARLTERRHIDGRELVGAVRDLALERFGVMARMVLEHWGVRATADVGDIVFTMVDLGLLMSQPTDSRLDFVDVYEFDRAFEQAYPWSAAHLS